MGNEAHEDLLQAKEIHVGNGQLMENAAGEN